MPLLSTLANLLLALLPAPATRQVPPAQRQLCFVLGGAAYELTRAAPASRYRELPVGTSQPVPPTGSPRADLALCRAIAEATGCQQFVFDQDADFAIGYLLARM